MEMGDKKIYLIGGIAGGSILILGTWLFLALQQPQPIPSAPGTFENSQIDEFTGLPTTLPGNGLNGEVQPPVAALEKERQFISAYYRPQALNYDSKSDFYGLPIENIKESVTNYRDVSRKLNLNGSLDSLSTKGFSVILDPFAPKPDNWQGSFHNLSSREIPIFVSSDALISVYQETLNQTYKEIEQNHFYNSLWEVTHGLYERANARFQNRYRTYGTSNDLLTEAARQEASFLAVALELLKPDESQIKDTISDSSSFSRFEAQLYRFTPTSQIEPQVIEEVELIRSRSKLTDSPTFLYERDYQQFKVPDSYKGSAKLSNYWLAKEWLSSQLYPLNPKSDSCPDCLLDEADWNINFLAGVLLSADLNSDQNLENQWANIYKSISFFKGLQLGLTYLDFLEALENKLGPQYDLEFIFEEDNDEARNKLASIRQFLKDKSFSQVLGGQITATDQTGLKLLRDSFLSENHIFPLLTNESAGKYIGSSPKPQPFTYCRNGNRCRPRGLDILAATGNRTARETLTAEKDDNYELYGALAGQLRANFNSLENFGWHENAYLSLLNGLNSLVLRPQQRYPSFMHTSAWSLKQLSTGLASWVEFHRPGTLQPGIIDPAVDQLSNLVLDTGYVEPLPELYSELLENTLMIRNGFLEFQIIDPSSLAVARLDALAETLVNAGRISISELTGRPFEPSDYQFINGFANQLAQVNGTDTQSIRLTINPYATDQGYQVSIGSLDLVVVVYSEIDGELKIAIGPVYSFREKAGRGKPSIAAWQDSYLDYE